MDWDRYKTLCDAPDVLSRWMLVQTIELLISAPEHRRLLKALETTVGSQPLRKPVDHLGGPATDMFRLSLSVAEAQGILSVVASALAAGTTTSGTLSRGLGGFVEAWAELVRHLSGCADQAGEGSDAESV